MNISVLWQKETKMMEIPEKSSIENLLDKIGINPETVVVMMNGEVTPEYEALSKGDKIEIIEIVSRG